MLVQHCSLNCCDFQLTLQSLQDATALHIPGTFSFAFVALEGRQGNVLWVVPTPSPKDQKRPAMARLASAARCVAAMHAVLLLFFLIFTETFEGLSRLLFTNKLPPRCLFWPLICGLSPPFLGFWAKLCMARINSKYVNLAPQGWLRPCLQSRPRPNAWGRGWVGGARKYVGIGVSESV